MKKGLFFIGCFILVVFFSILPVTASNNENTVIIIPIEEDVEKGLHAFLKRAVNTAEEKHADVIIFDINTPGGAVDAASEIGKLLNSTKIKKIAFVNNKALSAGAYISLFADEIYMVPDGTMGAAAIIDQKGNTAGKKAESYWRSAMNAAASQHGRNPIYAEAMAVENINLPDLEVKKGGLLTLTAEQAVKVGYSEGTVKNMDELLAKLGYEHANIEHINSSFAEKVARFLTNPIVVPILLSIASLGLVIELYSLGFGIPGTMGITALLLFFYGHLVAGLAGYESLILFIIGIVLIIAEFFLPGAIAGILGTAAIVGSLLIAGGNIFYMGISIIIAILVAIIGMIIMVKVLGKRMKLFKKIILSDSTSTDKGYVSNVNRLELVGKTGITMTPLRPAGTMTINDERLDVVSEGGYIDKGIKVKIIKVEGSRIVVRVDN
ncbi:NfeD family protein [Heyndrickxia sporothermodurans]|uniref:NfeD family protein n=1 Tax=Heyndrickxia sporothermodurans TaxID=46224 RepID=UPI001F2A553E